MLDFRVAMLDAARVRAREVGHAGALFPWRTINGAEASPRYASGTAQYHINGDVAYALRQHGAVTGDLELLRGRGAEVLVETARFWFELGFFSERRGGRFCINSVTGPDEYTTVVDNNAYTNLMAKENLESAVGVVEWLRDQHPEAHDRLVAATGVSAPELADWRRAADAMFVPRHEELGIVLQDDGFLERERWDFEGTPADRYPLLLHYHPLEIFRKQVIKQTDVVLATYLLERHFDAEEMRRTFVYYDALTTGDSTLSACIQSVVASAVGYPDAALRYFVDACTVDLLDTARQHRRRHPHRLVRRHLARPRRRLCGPAGRGRGGVVPPAPAGRLVAVAVPPAAAGPGARGGARARRDDVPAAPRRRDAHPPLRRGADRDPGSRGAPARAARRRRRGGGVVRLQAVVFDVDGVLVDSPHEQAWRDALAELMAGEWSGLRPRTAWRPDAFSPRVYAELVAGKPRLRGAQAALEHFGVPDAERRAVTYAARKQERIARLIDDGAFAAFPDALRFVGRAHLAGLRTAAASSSRNAPRILELLGLRFEVDVSGRDVGRGKPAPDLFLAAAAELGVAPARCLVVEDAEAGVRAAKAAGMVALAIARGDDAARLAAAGADRVVESLDDAELADLAAAA